MEKQKNKIKIEYIAYHEAGHVFAYWELDDPFLYVTIIKDLDDPLLYVKMNEDKIDLGHVKPVKQSRETKDSIIKGMKINLAGSISEKKYSKKPKSYLAEKDYEAFRFLALKLNNFVKPGEFGQLIEKIRFETIKMIDQNWADVELIAKELLRKKTITKKKIESLMKKHPLKGF